jgi:hypothetical protein
VSNVQGHSSVLSPLVCTDAFFFAYSSGVYPWDWVGDDIASFNALKGGLLVAPILQQLILNREPIEVLDFADEVAKWPFKRIIPAHFKVSLGACSIQPQTH